MLPDDVIDALAPYLGEAVRRTASVGGGCIARATRVDTDTRSFFLKWSRADVARTFPAEAAGLRALRAAESTLFVPEPLVARDAADGQPGILLLPWIEQGAPGADFWEAFGRGLAGVHRHTARRYGFDEDNFIGRLPQENGWYDDWASFFRERRLEPQVRRAREHGRWQRGWNASLASLYAALPDILPRSPEASILHGDLWSGNYLVTASGTAALIDPAAYFGHREADLAMTELFGGFDRRFYAAYREAWPLDAGYDVRRDVYNLYHLINHLNHFGGGYAGSVEAILQRWRRRA